MARLTPAGSRSASSDSIAVESATVRPMLHACPTRTDIRTHVGALSAEPAVNELAERLAARHGRVIHRSNAEPRAHSARLFEERRVGLFGDGHVPVHRVQDALRRDLRHARVVRDEVVSLLRAALQEHRQARADPVERSRERHEFVAARDGIDVKDLRRGARDGGLTATDVGQGGARIYLERRRQPACACIPVAEGACPRQVPSRLPVATCETCQ